MLVVMCSVTTVELASMILSRLCPTLKLSPRCLVGKFVLKKSLGILSYYLLECEFNIVGYLSVVRYGSASNEWLDWEYAIVSMILSTTRSL